MCLVKVFAGSKRKPEADSYVVRFFCCLKIWCTLGLFGDFENFKICSKFSNIRQYEMVTSPICNVLMIYIARGKHKHSQ